MTMQKVVNRKKNKTKCNQGKTTSCVLMDSRSLTVQDQDKIPCSSNNSVKAPSQPQFMAAFLFCFFSKFTNRILSEAPK